MRTSTKNDQQHRSTQANDSKGQNYDDEANAEPDETKVPDEKEAKVDARRQQVKEDQLARQAAISGTPKKVESPLAGPNDEHQPNEVDDRPLAEMMPLTHSSKSKKPCLPCSSPKSVDCISWWMVTSHCQQGIFIQNCQAVPAQRAGHVW